MIVYSEIEKSYLDYAPFDNKGAYIEVDRIMVIEPVASLYFERQKSLRLVWNYICDIGFKNTLIKVLSRSAEKDRNKKFIMIGMGRIYGTNDNSMGVLFVAPKHPAFLSRIWLPEFLFHRNSKTSESEFLTVMKTKKIAEYYMENFRNIAGWDPFSGECQPKIDWVAVNEVLSKAKFECSYKKKDYPILTQTSSISKNSENKQFATLFGFGNYAKTIIIPSLPKEIVIDRIHEVDPLQIPDDNNYIWDTSPVLSENDSNKIVFIAGYHHTHNDLACEALKLDLATVVEKPLVTTRVQLSDLEQAFKISKGSYFSCFHKRYSLFNNMAKVDLGLTNEAGAINYHCIVYEVPLPEKHWYRWKNSSTRIISNGCHWIDHFLYLNDFSEPTCIEGIEASDGTVSVFIELFNSACFTMTLTDKGSEKIGVQDHIELRRGDVTVKITNGTIYQAEGRDKTLRKKIINKISSYWNMYSQIGKEIISGASGDSWESTRISSEAVLSVNELIEKQRKII